nr:DUF5937 family protein [Promicromonospora sp. MEB111]
MTSAVALPAWTISPTVQTTDTATTAGAPQPCPSEVAPRKPRYEAVSTTPASASTVRREKRDIRTVTGTCRVTTSTVFATKMAPDHTGDASSWVTRTSGSAISLAADLRLKNDLLRRQGTAAALASVSDAVTLAPDGDSIVVDKLQDNATAAHGAGPTFLPSVFGRPHLMVVHAPGWQPVVQYPVAEASPAEPVSLETVTFRLEALAHPVRLRLLRTLARGPHTTGELAHAWELSPPEVSRHLAVLR